MKTHAEPMVYAGLGTETLSSESVPSLAPGLGTRIGVAAALIGGRDQASHLIGVSTPSLQRYIKEVNMPPFDAVVRLCLASGKSLHWMATGAEPPAAPSQPVRPDVGSLQAAVETVDTALELAGVAVGAADRAALYVSAYELLQGAQSVPQATAQVLKLIMGGKR